MRLIRDEYAYFSILDDFVAGRMSAALFIPCFERLWQRDQVVAIDSTQARSGEPANPPGLYGLLDSVDSLCGIYVHNLPAGGGYRVSEEQFRKEIESMTSVLRLGRLHEA